jgi:hypothetical protein
LSDIRTVHALQVSQRSCVSRTGMVDLSEQLKFSSE